MAGSNKSLMKTNMLTTGIELISVLFLASSLSAQQTPTEREAARSVLVKMMDFEKSLNLESVVRDFTKTNVNRESVVASARELMVRELLAMSDDITRHPEVSFEERRSVTILTDYLERHDFAVQSSVAGLPTAFVARWKRSGGHPVLGVIVEYDALRGVKGAFHGDQHSAQGPIGIAAALAIADYLSKTKTPGSIVIYGTPGEERMPPNAKVVMHAAGVFSEADLIVRSHSSVETARAGPGFGTCCLNIDGVRYVFTGAPAHQLEAWNGRNALEAVIHLFENIDSVRSSIRPEARIQGVITEGGTAPNVVPDRATADFYIRYPDAVYLKQVREFTDNAARAAALSTGTTVQIDHYGQHRDGISTATLEELAFAYVKKYGAIEIKESVGPPIGYEETGMVSRDIPGVGFNAFTSNGNYHTYEMEADALSEVGHNGFITDAQAMAAVLFDFATNSQLRQMVKDEHRVMKTLFIEYQKVLESAYVVPRLSVPLGVDSKSMGDRRRQ